MRARGFQNKSIINIIFSKAKIIIILALIFIVFISIPVFRKMNQKNALDKEIRALEDQAAVIEQKNKELNNVIDYLHSDAFVEKEARVHLDMQKAGEKVVVIQDQSKAADNSDDVDTVFIVPGLEKEESISTINNRNKWWDYFFSATK